MKKRIMTLLLTLALLLTMAAPAFAEEPVYTTVESAAAVIHNALVAHVQTISLEYSSEVEMTKESWTELVHNIVDKAMEHHRDQPTWGDYIRWQYGGYHIELRSLPHFCTFTFEFTYYTTLAQEQELDAWVRDFVMRYHLISPRISDYDKVCIIYDWLCENVRYDNENLENKDYLLKYTAYAAAINRTAVCQGYAVLFYRLALESGVDARLIAGYSGVNENGEPLGHAWNIVYLAGRAYLLDATWDENVPQSSRRYFLKGIDTFDAVAAKQVHTLYTLLEASPMKPTYDYTALSVSDSDLERERGDVNGDGKVTTKDAVLTDMQCLYEYLATGTITGAFASNKAAFFTAADVNYNGTVDMLDYQYLYNLYQSMLSPT